MMSWFKSFTSPDREYRPKVRYWMPHAVVSERGIERDIEDLAARGFGGIEVVTMRDSVDYRFFNRENMWGSKAWIGAMRILLREAKKHSLTVDFANGPSWPIADIHATSPDDESVIRELAYGLRIIGAGEHYEGDIPMPEPDKATPYQRLISLALYRISGENEIDIDSYTPIKLADTVSLTVPTDGDYALFAFYDKPSVLRMNSGLFYVVDHFSRAGTDAIMDVWENELMPELEEYKDIIECLFCDSLEYIVQLEWTRDLPERFEKEKGYGIIPYLPCLGNIETVGSADRNLGVFPPTKVSGYYLSDRDRFVRVNHDFFDVINKGYCHEHLEYMQKRAEAMGLTVRYQVAYNKNLEAESSALYVGIPENEPLGRPLLDNFRIMSAAVNLDRKPVYSYECAAEPWFAYGQTHEDLLWWVKRSYAGGMNSQVLHGANYCGYFDGEGNDNGVGPCIHWPGFEGFTHPRWANAWNRTLNVDGQRQILDQISRCNYLLRNTHKIDVAVYRHEYKNNCYMGAYDGGYLYQDGNALNDAGYTYEFLSPSLFSHENAVVKDGVFDPEGAAYKAIIVNNEEYIDFRAAEKLLDYSRAGLTVVFVGRIPSKCYFESGRHTDRELEEIISRIDHVFVEDIHDVPSALRKKGILPAIMPEIPCEIRPVRLDICGAAFYYIYNSHTVKRGARETLYPYIDKDVCMSEYSGIVSLDSLGDVYEIDPFSCKVTWLDSWAVGGRTEVYLDLAKDEAKIIAVLNGEQAEMLGICGDFAHKYDYVGECELEHWSLRIRSIHYPENRACTFYESVWSEEEKIMLDSLKPWCDIKSEWEKICGIGVYETEFRLDKTYKKAVFKLERVCDTYELFVNGIKFDVVDPVRQETDITEALKNGRNEIKVVVYSTLMNRVAYDYIKENGKMDKPQKSGMWGKTSVLLFN